MNDEQLEAILSEVFRVVKIEQTVQLQESYGIDFIQSTEGRHVKNLLMKNMREIFEALKKEP